MHKMRKLRQRRVIAASEALLDYYRLPPISEAHYILDGEMWELVVDIDQLQADLAGSRTWADGDIARALRMKFSNDAQRIADAVRAFGLEQTADSLGTISAELTEYS